MMPAGGAFLVNSTWFSFVLYMSRAGLVGKQPEVQLNRPCSEASRRGSRGWRRGSDATDQDQPSCGGRSTRRPDLNGRVQRQRVRCTDLRTVEPAHVWLNRANSTNTPDGADRAGAAVG